MHTEKFSETLSLEELKYIADEYGKLVQENAGLINFKEIVMKHLTKEQVVIIEDEMENTPETNY